MKTGTLVCWLFGHKFIGREIKNVPIYGIEGKTHEVQTTYYPTSQCVRCGIDKPVTTNSVNSV